MYYFFKNSKFVIDILLRLGWFILFYKNKMVQPLYTSQSQQWKYRYMTYGRYGYTLPMWTKLKWTWCIYLFEAFLLEASLAKCVKTCQDFWLSEEPWASGTLWRLRQYLINRGRCRRRRWRRWTVHAGIDFLQLADKLNVSLEFNNLFDEHISTPEAMKPGTIM